MYGPLTDDVIYHYIHLEYKFYADESPEKFAELTDEQVTTAILKHMESEMEPMRPVGK